MMKKVKTRMMRKLKKYKPTRFMSEGSYYDKDAADYAVGFIECLCHRCEAVGGAACC